jgi:N-hydroxyarylamine O-acetyltransferase
MDFDRYYRRLGIDRPSPDMAGLRRLQSAQMDAVTFENIDPLLGIVPDVSLEGIFDKIVVRGRGGYCFELNTLFGAALRQAGFDAKRIMARVRNGAPQGANRSHLAWIVTIDGEEWLADTGFGGSGTSIPLPLASREVQQAPTGRYRFTQDEAAGELVLERETPDGWYSLFGFDRVPVRDADIEAANFVTARWEKGAVPHQFDAEPPYGRWPHQRAQHGAAHRNRRRRDQTDDRVARGDAGGARRGLRAAGRRIARGRDLAAARRLRPDRTACRMSLPVEPAACAP